MTEIYRTEQLNYKSVFENIVNGAVNYLVKNNIKAQILGISGGIDSTITAALCSVISNKIGIPLIGVSLPCSTNKDDEKSSATMAGGEFCNEFIENNIQDVFEVLERACKGISGIGSTAISQGNLKARLRGMILYDIASKNKGIVMDTDNLSENSLGFWTISGGDETDFNLIGGLWKHEVYEFAIWLRENVFKDSEALKAAIEIIPTDGNGVKDGGDLAQIAPGKTYADVDEILMQWVNLDGRIKDYVVKSDFNYGVFTDLCKKHTKDIVKMVINRSINSEFKRRHRPLIIDIFRGYVCDKDGKIIP